MSDLITLRKKKSSKFYSVDLRIIENSNLSWAAKGVWTYLISRPDGWAVNRSDLLGKSKDGDTALRAILKELSEAGLLKIERVKVKGKFGPTVWIVSEEHDLSDVENPHVEKPCVENPHVVNPQAEKPHVENQHDLESTSITNYHLTNYQDTKDQQDPPIAPQGAVCVSQNLPITFPGNWQQVDTKPSESEASLNQIALSETTQAARLFPPVPAARPVDNSPGFDEFWQQYPAKVAKPAALKAWRKLKPGQALQDAIAKDIAIRKENDRKWVDGFVPNPATYLNQERWNDDIQPLKQQSKPMSKHDQNMAVLANYANKKGVKVHGLN